MDPQFLLEGRLQRPGQRGSATKQPVEPEPLLHLDERRQHRLEDSGDAAAAGDSGLDHQGRDEIRDHETPGEDDVGSRHQARVRKAPRVRMEHGHHQDGHVLLGKGEAVNERQRVGVQHVRSV